MPGTGESVETGTVEHLRLPGGWRIALTLLLVISTLYVYATWLIDTRPLMNMNGYENARFVDMVYGRAHRPFVYRVLVPTIVREARALIPDPVNYVGHGRIYARFPALYGAMVYLGWELEYLTEYAVAVVLMYASLLGFAYAFKRLVRSLYSVPECLQYAASILAVWILPVFFVKGTHYLYDLPQLALFTLLLGSLRKQQWWSFYALFAVGLFNKETTVFATAVYLMYFWRRVSAATLVRHAGAQLVICGGVRAFLAWRFAGNPGGVVENHLRMNLYNALLRPYDLNAVVSIAAVVLLIGYAFCHKPLLMRRALWVALPMGAFYAVLGTYGEIRVFYELYPVVLLLCLHTAADLLGYAVQVREDSGLKGIV